MTAPAVAAYDDWKAPPGDGELLIWPEPADLLSIVSQNNSALDRCEVLIQNQPLGALRQQQRMLLGHAESSQPLIASGHQTELYHPGVWVKDVLADLVARRTGGSAMHLAVETDQPKHLTLRFPGVSVPISDDPALTSAAWSGLIAAPSPDHLKQIGHDLEKLQERWNFEPMLRRSLATLLGGAAGGAGASLSARLTAAQRSMDRELGLSLETAMVGALCEGEPYLLFAHHILAHADRFAADYNAALAQYRAQAGISSPTRPMPDLQLSTDQVETPFWLDDLRNASRTRAAVQADAGGRWQIFHGGECFRFDAAADGSAAAKLAQFLKQHHLRLAPRALTLTMFLRLLLVDLFVHGIGGGRYDQVSDRLIHRHFGIVPPRFAVTTATLLFPAAVGRSRVCLGCLAQEGHTLRHGLLGQQKQQIVQQIAALPRRSLERSIAFHNLHSCLSAAAMSSSALRQWQARYQEAEQQHRQDQVLFDRELFYALQPQDRLAELIDRYAAAVG